MDEQQKRYIAKMLTTHIKPADLAICDNCGTYSLTEHMHKQYGSMRKEYSQCPECDLPPFWHSKFSKSSHKRYFIRYNPKEPNEHIVTWGHPTKGNPLYIEGDVGERIQRKRHKHVEKN